MNVIPLKASIFLAGNGTPDKFKYRVLLDAAVPLWGLQVGGKILCMLKMKIGYSQNQAVITKKLVLPNPAPFGNI